MSQHTPGPWRWHQSHDGTSLRTPDRGQLIVMDVSESGELRFARRGPADRGGWLQEARVMAIGPRPLKTGFYDIDNPDACLIEAAPDLLEACETAVRIIEQLIPEKSARGVANVVLFELRSAIAKARGESPAPTKPT